MKSKNPHQWNGYDESYIPEPIVFESLNSMNSRIIKRLEAENLKLKAKVKQLKAELKKKEEDSKRFSNSETRRANW